METGYYEKSGRLYTKLTSFVAECEEFYGIRTVYHDQISIHTLKQIKKAVVPRQSTEMCSCMELDVENTVCRNPWNSWINIWRNNERNIPEKLYTLGDRNSCSKTDRIRCKRKLSFIEKRTDRLYKAAELRFQAENTKRHQQKKNMEYHADRDSYICRNGRN